MKSLKKLFALSLCSVFALLGMSSTFAYANNTQSELPENWKEMSPVECIQWIEENIPETMYKGILLNPNQRGMTRSYRGWGVNYHESMPGIVQMKLETTVDWVVDIDSYTIESYSVEECLATTYDIPTSKILYDETSYYVLPTNLKLFLQAETVILFGGGQHILMGHEYNLHAAGNFSLRYVDYGSLIR